MRRPRLAAAPAAAVLLLATACSGGSGSAPDPAPAEPSTSAPTATATPPPRAREAASPEEGACYDLGYADALAPTTDARATGCDRRHTARTFVTGRLETVVDGHLLAVDSARVRQQPERECEQRLPGFLGGTEEARRLSMLRTVWFTPTVAQSDRGAEWFRCDVIAVGADEELADLGPDLEGALTTAAGAGRYGMCGTAAPDDDAFERVVCAREHTWRAISVVDLPDGDYPGEAAAREAGQVPCEDAGQAAAADPAEFEWGYEWPDADQWAAGQTYGRCWAPD